MRIKIIHKLILASILGIVSLACQAQNVPDLAGQLSGGVVGEFAAEVCGYQNGDAVAVVPEGVTAIPAFAFAGAQGLQKIVLPESLEEIGAHAFAYCPELREVSLPENLKRIRQCAFVLCESLETIEIPQQVTELESYAFAQCRQLRRASLPANGSLLGELIFSCCDSLEEIVESSRVVPMFDCASMLFDADDSSAWSRCCLRVPADMKESYSRAPGWDRFEIIEAI